MRALFYNAVEMITERITGIENGTIKLWEFGWYMGVSDEVALVLNISIAAIILASIWCIIHYAKKAWVSHGN